MCSVSCGGGIMHRDVECIQEFAVGFRNGIHLPDYMCEQPVPTRNRKCNSIDCHSEWLSGPWSKVNYYNYKYIISGYNIYRKLNFKKLALV